MTRDPLLPLATCPLSRCVVHVTPLDVAEARHSRGCSKLLRLHGGLPWAEARQRPGRSSAALVRVTSAPDIRRWAAATGATINDKWRQSTVIQIHSSYR